MHRLPFSGRFLALALILVLLTVRLGALSRETFVQPVQDFLFKTAHVSSEDAKQKPSTLKPKRPSVDLFCSRVEVAVAYQPLITALVPFSPFHALPEVYLDIFIPPDKTA